MSNTKRTLNRQSSEAEDAAGTRTRRPTLRKQVNQYMDRLRWFEHPNCDVADDAIEREKGNMMWDIRQLALASGRPDIAAECCKPGNTADQVSGFVAALDQPHQVGEFLTVGEVATLFKIDERTIRRRVADGSFPKPVAVGKRAKRWRKVDLDRLW